MTRASAAITRPARTAIQAAPAYVVTEFVDAFLWDMDDRQYAAAAILLTLVFGWAQVLTENRLGKGLLRDVPPTTDPVPGG